MADYKDTGGFALTEKFQNYRVSLESDEWRGTARTLADYAERDGIQADAVLKSGSDKTVCFENLSNGLYLVKVRRSRRRITERQRYLFRLFR